MARPLRVVHVIPSLGHERGGPTAVVQNLVRHQVVAGHQVTVATTDQGTRHGELLAEMPSNVVVNSSRVVGPDRMAYAPGFGRQIRDSLADCDIVHVHSLFTYPVHAALREALKMRTPVVVRPCGHLHRYSLLRSPWRKRIYLARWGGLLRRACSAWHFTSNDEAVDSWPWDDSPRFVLPNGVEPDEFAIDRNQARVAINRVLPQLADSPYVLFLGRLHPKKRLDLLITSFLAGAPAEYRLVVAGPDEAGLWPELNASLSRSAKARIVRVGTVQGSQKAELLAAADLFALPSEHENFGIAVLEALAAGTPVFVSPHVDLASAIGAAELGRSLPLDFSTWRDALAATLPSSPPAAFVKRARSWVAENYAWDRIAAQLERHYQDIARQPSH